MDIHPAIRPDVAAFLAMLAALDRPPPWQIGATEARRQYRDAASLLDPPIGPLAAMHDLTMPGPGGDIALRVFEPRRAAAPGPALVFLHGGGWVLGDVTSHAPLCAEIARTLDLPVISVDYRLAPEHRYPAAADDCEAAARWIAAGPADLGLNVTGLVLAGDSAGGSLAITTALALRDRPAAVPLRALCAFYPAVGRGADFVSYERFGTGFALTREMMDWFVDCYAADLDDWRGAPLLGELAGLPPTLIVTAGLDPLVDQGRAFAAACTQAGVAITYREAAGTIHGFACRRQAIPSAAGDLANALSLLGPMIGEAR